jgi:hypothetical protein
VGTGGIDGTEREKYIDVHRIQRGPYKTASAAFRALSLFCGPR